MVQGVRRVVALTGDAARGAQATAQALHRQLASAEALIGDAMQAELTALRQVPPSVMAECMPVGIIRSASMHASTK